MCLSNKKQVSVENGPIGVLNGTLSILSLDTVTVTCRERLRLPQDTTTDWSCKLFISVSFCIFFLYQKYTY